MYRWVTKKWVKNYQVNRTGKGGEGGGLDWCMTKTGVRHTRILDPVHVLSARSKARGGERKKMIDRIRGLLKIFNRVPNHIVLTRWDPV
jgi:hypothetical protein